MLIACGRAPIGAGGCGGVDGGTMVDAVIGLDGTVPDPPAPASTALPVVVAMPAAAAAAAAAVSAAFGGGGGFAT